MARAAPIQPSFNAGELSPRFAGRIDQARYAVGCHRLENFIPDIAGPAVKRGGTVYVASVKDPTRRVWLARFEFSASQAFILEFGHEYIRFYTNRGVLLSGGVPYEIASPYTGADLTNDAGGFAISYVQSGDVLYLAHKDHQPRKLSRLAATNWTFEVYEPEGGPFKTVNADATTVYASAATGSVTLKASAGIFTAAMAGSLFYLEQNTASAVKQWEVGKTIAAGDIRRSDGKNYEALNAATTGTVKPVHTEGSAYDGDAGVQWQFLDPGYGWVRITGFTSATEVTADVLSRIPDGAVSAPNASTKWALGAWSGEEGWPDAVTFYLDRLVFAKGQDVYMSVAGDYEVMKARDFGEQLTESAIVLAIPSRRGNRILWMETLEAGLVVGTGSDEWLIAPASRNEPLGPVNVAPNPLGAIGSRAIPVIRLFDSIIFAQRSGTRLRDLKYEFGDGTVRADLNALADHIGQGGFTSIAYTAEPHSMIWAARADGLLTGLVYYPEQEVLGWARFPVEGEVECVQAIPAPDGSIDDLWMVVRRTIDGATTRYVERMQPPLADDGQQKDAFYVDSGLTYAGSAATTISGLDHLEGCTVNILADGATHPQRTVTAGSIELQREASVVQVGLPYTAMLATMDLEAGSRNGTAQGKIKRVYKLAVRLLRTLGGKVGPSEDKLDTLHFRDATVPMGQAPALFTGDKPVPWPGGSDRQARVWFVHDEPLPCTVVAVMPQLVTED